MPETPPEAADTVSFVPRDALRTALRGWWLVAAAVVLGGMLGMLFSALQPPLFVSDFSFPTSIDEVNSGEMAQFERDLAMETVGGILYNPDLFARVAKEAGRQGLSIDGAGVKNSALVERRIGTWWVHVYGKNAQDSLTLASIWRELAAADIDDARVHALAADRYYRQQISLEACLAESASAEPSAGLCGSNEFLSIQEQLAQTTQNIAKERAASRAMPGMVLVDTSLKEILPARPVLYNRNQVVAAGMLIGLVAGIWLAQAGLADRLRAGRRER
jgi:hypothetical protein